MYQGLKGHLGLPSEDYQHAEIDEFLCMVAGCTFGTDVWHWMCLKKANMMQGLYWFCNSIGITLTHSKS